MSRDSRAHSSLRSTSPVPFDELGSPTQHWSLPRFLECCSWSHVFPVGYLFHTLTSHRLNQAMQPTAVWEPQRRQGNRRNRRMIQHYCCRKADSVSRGAENFFYSKVESGLASVPSAFRADALAENADHTAIKIM